MQPQPSPHNKILYTLTCHICGKKFKARYSRRRHICDRPECRDQRAHGHYLAWRKRHGKGIRDLNIVATCPYCGNEYTPKRHNQITCGSVACAKKHNAEASANRRREIKEGIRKPAPSKYDKDSKREVEYLPDLPKVIRECLKCGKLFLTDVNWTCDRCRKINAGIYTF